MAFIPYNIEKRRFRAHYSHAPYRAWDGAGRVYSVSRNVDVWVAWCRDHNLPSLKARTFAQLSALLEAVR
ncbi:hypothetical protein GG804_01880 [Sphingomonas histidinilytica]|uniref:hypothetical protein n=1 Tax=Rhizorhabdus histidinilytica TaxID=439228 RepID=UPI00076FE10C|nr:hypothetical protein [Rhizorhabdus histidinilytica]AMK23267.1 hypothetical protein K426_11655 [Sphingobium sp. TKS]MBO9375507.1 hypothetical protein [Rhizorhabdus histidinilytica]